MRVYLAEPIDQLTERYWVAAELQPVLEKAGHEVYAPAVFDEWPVDTSKQGFNMEMLGRSDALVALLPDAVATIGVPLELGAAHVLGKRCVVLGGEVARHSTVLAGLGITALEGWAVPALLRLLAGDIEPQEEPSRHAMWLETVAAEMARAERKHPDGESNTVARWFSVWAEETVEVFQAWNDRVDWESRAEIAEEVVQVGAMSGRLWEALVLEDIPKQLFLDPDVGPRKPPPGMIHDRAREQDGRTAYDREYGGQT